MANSPPLPTEMHRLVIILDGAKLKGGARTRARNYYKYLAEMKKLAKSHGAKVHAKELHLKQRVINDRKRRIMKLLKGKLT